MDNNRRKLSIMTIFEQTIDTSQVQMGWSFLGFLLIMLAVYAITFALIMLLFEKRPRIMKNNPFIFIFSLGLTAYAGFAGTIFSPVYISPAQALSEPVYSEHQSRKIEYDSKDTVTDIYREDIDKAIKEKLGEYDIPEYSIDNPRKSVLGGGDEERSIAAVHDGKTYTLTPHWDYDRDASKVTLSVDIEEGYHVK